MNKQTIIILVFLILQVTSSEVKSDVNFSKDFIEEAKNLGIDIKQNKQQSTIPRASTKIKPSPSAIKSKVQKVSKTPLPPVQSKVLATPKPPTKPKKVTESSSSITTTKPLKPALPTKTKQEVESEIKSTAKPVTYKKKTQTADNYFVAPEEKINNQDFDEKAFRKRYVYSYKEMPSKALIDQQNKGKNMHLPKFMTQKELSKLLFVAVNEENIGAIKALLQRRVDINVQDKYNQYTPLMYAVKDNKINSLRYLLVKGADPNIKGINQMSALHLAAVLNRLKILRILLQSGANIFAEDKHYKTFYDYVPRGYLSIVINDVYETRKNADDALLDFCVLGSLKGVIYSLQNQASINAKNQDGDTPLILAVRYRHQHLISYLLGAGADIAIKDRYNNDAAIIAKLNNYNKIYDIIETVRFNKQLYILGLADNIIPYKLTSSK